MTAQLINYAYKLCTCISNLYNRSLQPYKVWSELLAIYKLLLLVNLLIEEGRECTHAIKRSLSVF